MFKYNIIVLLLSFFCWPALALADQSLNKDIRAIPVGDLVVYELCDCQNQLPHGVLVYPEGSNLPSQNKPKDFQFPSIVKTFLVKAKDRIILIDTGYGEDLPKKGETLKLLAKLGVTPNDVTDILLTHLDVDHQSGLMHQGKKVFPKANLYISEPEVLAWTQNKGLVNRGEDNPKRAKASLLAYKDKLKTFKLGDKILDQVETLDLSGHTPGHTGFKFSSQGQTLIIAGDFIHIPAIQLAHPEISSIWDGQGAAKTRQKLLQELCDTKAILASMHMIEVGLVKKDPKGGYRLEVLNF
ncbi:MAG: MBL fold metallo-hydrolase [Desulfovibrionaceae bacterium]|nr:MBL fold metallo-hydrolase [Desulfovibrionaceae bacterium]